MDKKEIEERYSLIETIKIIGLEVSEIIPVKAPAFTLKIVEKTIIDKKKIEEFYYLIETIKIIELKLSEIIIREDPDFILKIGKKTIGAEVRGYYIDAGQKKGSKARAVEEYDNYIMEMVNEKVKKNSNLKGIMGSFTFKNQDRPEKKELTMFIDELIKCAIESINKDKNAKEIGVELTDAHSILKKYLLFFTLNKLPFQWSLTRGGSVGFSEENLIKVIQPKIEKTTKYKKSGNFDELWLIVGGGIFYSQVVPPLRFVEDGLKNFNKLDNILKTSGFSKIYLCFRSDNEAVFEWPGWNKIEPKTS